MTRSDAQFALQIHSSPAKRQQDRAIVLAWYLEHTGSAHECAKGLGMLYTTVLPRVTELKKDGCLQRIPGVRHETGLGGTAAVLVVTGKGRDEARGVAA